MQQIYGNVTKVLVESRQGSNLLYWPVDKIMRGVAEQPAVAAVDGPPTAPSSAPAAAPSGFGNDSRTRDNSRSRDRELR